MHRLFGDDQCYNLFLSDNLDNGTATLKADVFTFPGGEPHVKLTWTTGETIDDSYCSPIRIFQTIKSFNDLGVLMMTVNAIRDKNDASMSLVLPYFPGARQDRMAADVCEPLTVKVYADLINSLKFDEVIIFDPHSEVAPALLNNCVVLTNEKFVEAAVPKGVPFVFVSPDAGAAKKTEKLLKINSFTRRVDIPDIIYFRKQRDMKTGKLSGFHTEMIDLLGIDCVVVDDICDGGGTFIAIAEQLEKMNCGALHLIVSHGIFSKGVSDLLRHYQTITTTNSWLDTPYVIVSDTKVHLQRLQALDLLKLYKL